MEFVKAFFKKSFRGKYIPLNSENLSDTIIDFAKMGYGSAHITLRDSNGNHIQPSLYMSKSDSPIDITTSIYQAFHALQNFSSGKEYCSVSFRLSKSAIQFLNRAPNMGFTKNSDGKTSQKEIAGELALSRIKKIGKNYIYILDIDKKSISHGSDEEVDVKALRINFHSHPRSAYKNHNVQYAWPSPMDFAGMIKIGSVTTTHLVATLEGLYVLSFNPYWGSRILELQKDKKISAFIKDNFNFRKKMYEPDPSEYLILVNKIVYEHEPIFHVQFSPWETLPGFIFTIKFPKSETGACLTTQKLLNEYKKVHGN